MIAFLVLKAITVFILFQSLFTFLFLSSTTFALLLLFTSLCFYNSPEYFYFSAENIFLSHKLPFMNPIFYFLHIPTNDIVIKRSREKLLISKSQTSNSVFMTIEFFEHLCTLYVPYLDSLIITTTKQFALIHFQTINPSLMPLVHLAFTCFETESSYYWIASSYKYVFLSDNHGFDGFF